MHRFEWGYEGTRKKGKFIPAGLALIALLMICFQLPAAEEAKPSVDRSRVYKLSTLTAAEAKEHLRRLDIGRRVDALSEKILIVTSDRPGDLIRATSVLEMLDSKSPRALRLWKPDAKAGLPAIEDIQSRLTIDPTNYGTLQNPPPPGVSQPVILDTHQGSLVILSAPDIAERVDVIVKDWTAKRLDEIAKTQAPTAPEPSEPPVPTKPSPSAPNEAAPMAQIPKTVREPNLPALTDPKLMEQIAEVMAEQPLAEPAESGEPKPTPAKQPDTEEQPGVEKKPPSRDEEFFNAELLKALTTAEEKARQLEKEIKAEKETIEAQPEPVIAEQQPATAEPKQPAAQPQIPAEEQPAGQEPLLTFLEALRRQSEQPSEPNRAVADRPKPAAEKVLTEAEPTSDLARLEAQLARQEQQIAELKALLMERARQPQRPVRLAPEMSEPEIPEGEKELELTITLPEKVEITALLELVGKQLGLNYMYDPAQVRGDVTLKIHDGKIKVKDTYALLESVLRFKGFVMTRRGNLVTIVPAGQMKLADPVIREPNDPIVPGDVVVSSVFQLRHVPVAAAQKMLTDMQLGTAFVPVTETNTLIVTDYAYRMDRVEKVIRMVDVAGEPKEFKYRQLEYMEAAQMVEKLKTLTAQMENVSVAGASTAAPAAQTQVQVRRDARGRVIRTPVRTPQQAQAAQPGGAVAEQETVFLDVDERTNRILMIGYPDQIQMINELIDTLDVPKYYLRYIREYFIQHVEAAEIVTAMNELGVANVRVSGGDQPAARTSARTAARPGQPQPPQQAAAPTAAASGEDQPYISIRPNTNSLLVNATKEQHEAIELVIAHVDVEQKDQRTIEEYEIQNVDALEVVTTLEDLGIISSGQSQESTTRGGGRQTSRRQPSGAQQTPPGQPEAPIALPTPEGETVTELTAAEPQIAVLESTNSLLVNATPRQHAAIALVIAHVDRTLEAVATPYVVYPLENQDPEELAAVLNELIQETLEQAQKSAPDAKIQTQPTAGAPLPGKEEERIRIIAEPKTYSLIVYANKKNQQWVGELIEQLDEYRPQVLLDCTLVEITKDDQFKYDIELVSKTYSTDGGSPPDSSVLRDTVGASLLNNSGFSLQRYAHGATSAGQITGFFNSEMVQGLLTAMQQNQYGRIMARPKILVNDNQEGEIKTEEIQAVAQIKTNVIPGTATQTSTTSQDAAFTDYTAGVTLKIKPHISKGDMLRLEITLNRTDFGTSTKTIPISDGFGGTIPVPYPPDRTTTDITTVSTIPDGATIILGGLEKLKQNKLQSKVPILGDLPLVGGLFRDVSNRDEQGKLYVFVKANILRPSDQAGGLEDMRRVSGRNRRAFEADERRFQQAQDWPGIDPKPMEPVRVLEEDHVDVSVSEEEALY